MKTFKVIMVIVVCCGLCVSITFAESMATEPRPAKILTQGDTMSRLSGEVLDLVKFYFNASRKKDTNAALSNLVKELAKKGYHLNSLPDCNDIRVGDQQRDLGKYSTAYHFATSDGNIWLDVVNYSGIDPIKGIVGGRLTFSGHFSPVGNRARWIFHTLNAEDDNALTAVFHSDTQLVNVGVSLPMAIKSTSNLSQVELEHIMTRIDVLYDIVRSTVQHLVSEKEVVMMPTLPGQELTAAQRVLGFVRFWSEVKYNFAFFDQVPDINWDGVLNQYLPEVMREQTTFEYYRLLQKICAMLKDGHTSITPPTGVFKGFDSPKIELRNVKGKAIVVNVGKSLENTIPLYSEIIAVDDVPTEIYLQKETFPYISSSTEHILWDWAITKHFLKGPHDTEMIISYRSFEGKTGKAKVTRNSTKQREDWIIEKTYEWKRLEFKLLESEIAYVALNTFADKTIIEDFENLLPEIRKSKGLILDIRKNGGGNSSIGWAILEHLTNQPFSGLTWKTPEHRPVYKAWGQWQSRKTPEQLANVDEEDLSWIKKAVAYYEGKVWYESEPEKRTPPEGEKVEVPIVVLIGHVTGSAAEDFLISMDSIKRATFVGQKTNGSTGQPLTFNLPGGGSARVCTVKATYPDGREFVGYGISPHEYIEPSIEDILKDRDVVLEKGVGVLREKISQTMSKKNK